MKSLEREREGENTAGRPGRLDDQSFIAESRWRQDLVLDASCSSAAEFLFTFLCSLLQQVDPKMLLARYLVSMVAVSLSHADLNALTFSDVCQRTLPSIQKNFCE